MIIISKDVGVTFSRAIRLYRVTQPAATRRPRSIHSRLSLSFSFSLYPPLTLPLPLPGELL